MNQNSKHLAFLLALVANVLWASSFVGSKLTLESWGPYTVAILRFLLSALVLFVSYKLLGVKAKRPKGRKQWFAVGSVGVILGGLYIFQLSGLVSISSGLSAAIMLLAPLLLVLLAPIITKESLEAKKVIASVLGIIGGIVLLSDSLSVSADLSVGVVLTILAAVCLALFTLVNRKFSGSVTHSTMTLYSFLVGSVVLIPFVVFENINTVSLPSGNLLTSSLAFFYLATVCTALPFFIWNKATAMTEAKNLASAMHAKTPVAIIFGMLVLGESLTVPVLIGTLIVTFALWLSQYESKKAAAVQKEFQPDLTIEATNSCDRACSGCYAANIYTGKNNNLNFVKNLSEKALKEIFLKTGSVGLTSIRGGEPTMNPEITTLLEVASANSKQVVLETHGRWIKEESELLKICRNFAVTIKISFDSMHGLSSAELQKLCNILDNNSISYLVAITEFSDEEFQKVRSMCSWISDANIVFQKKAKKLSDLMKPKIGVVKVNGLLESTLSAKKYFGRQNA